MSDMMKCLFTPSRKLSVICGLFLFLDAPLLLLEEHTPAAISAFNLYSKSVESRLSQQHRSRNAFLAPWLPISKALKSAYARAS
jgi:hypothetical protein